MAVVNQYLFYGVTLATTDETTMFDPADTLPLISETYIIKSFRVTNNTGNTPTITIKNNTFNIDKLLYNKDVNLELSINDIETGLSIEGRSNNRYEIKCPLKEPYINNDIISIRICYSP